MGRPVVHWEFMSQDPEKVSDFYAKIFGWKVRHVPQLNYRLVETGAKGEMRGINGGIVKPEREGPWPGNMLFYVLVDDLAAYRRKIVDAGGVIHVEEQDRKSTRLNSSHSQISYAVFCLKKTIDKNERCH